MVEVFRLVVVHPVAQGGRVRGCHRHRIKAEGRWMTYLRKAQSESWKLVIRGSVAVSSLSSCLLLLHSAFCSPDRVSRSTVSFICTRS